MEIIFEIRFSSFRKKSLSIEYKGRWRRCVEPYPIYDISSRISYLIVHLFLFGQNSNPKICEMENKKLRSKDMKYNVPMSLMFYFIQWNKMVHMDFVPDMFVVYCWISARSIWKRLHSSLSFGLSYCSCILSVSLSLLLTHLIAHSLHLSIYFHVYIIMLKIWSIMMSVPWY